jgi:hypothetical protein
MVDEDRAGGEGEIQGYKSRMKMARQCFFPCFPSMRIYTYGFIITFIFISWVLIDKLTYN